MFSMSESLVVVVHLLVGLVLPVLVPVLTFLRIPLNILYEKYRTSYISYPPHHRRHRHDALLKNIKE
jgi:hypothetical protein